MRELLSPPVHPELLGRLGRYEIERKIGAGGLGAALLWQLPAITLPALVVAGLAWVVAVGVLATFPKSQRLLRTPLLLR